MIHEDKNKILFLGIGGKGAYYVAKFFLLLDKDVYGYDLKQSDNTKDLESNGAKITYRNPEKGESLEYDLIVYSNDIPQGIQKQIMEDNQGKKFVEVGHLYNDITQEYEKGNMNERQESAFFNSNIAPLYSIEKDSMKYISVTGTDGKTTTCTMIYHILKNLNFKPALITTVSAKIGDEDIDTGFHTTTPTSQELFNLIKKAQDAKCTHLILESTSHGLEQGRLSGLKFDVVGYTNITNEHLDYHKTWDSYCNAKSFLISKHLKDDGKVVLNMDDKSYQYLATLNENPLSYSIKEKTDLYALDIVENDNSIVFKTVFNNKTVDSFIGILGKYNVGNFLCACGICLEMGIDIQEVVQSIKDFQTVKGRMEIIQTKPFYVVVDYAHTPNALENALLSARKLVGEGKLIHVFGCAGQRDSFKRPQMGKISKEISDITILTAEDPRLESLEEINDSIKEGWDSVEGKKELIRFDFVDRDVDVRRDAIKKALELAKEGDLVIITGKAHESSLCFNQTEYPWNDIEETKKLLSL